MSHYGLAGIDQRLFYLLDISREALAANRYTDKKWHQMTADKTMSTLTKTSPYVTGSDS